MSTGVTEFANNSRYALKSTGRPLTFVLGNEAGDLDSVACAIIYGCFLQELYGGKRSVIPVMNMGEQEMELRRDNMWVLKEIGVKPSSLVYTDTFSLAEFSAKMGAEIVLVDHNELSIFQESLSPKVVSIIDHHADAGLGKGRMEVRVVEKCGSCLSLVLREMERAKSKLCMDPAVVFCAVATIMLDTGFLSPELKKTTDLDVRFYKTYITEMKVRDEKAFFDNLCSMRSDLSGLSFVQLMGKDAKFFKVPEGAPKENHPGEPFGCSTIVSSFTSMEKQSKNCYDEFCKFGASRKLFLFFILTAYMENKSYKRELGMFTTDGKLAQSLVRRLEAEEMLKSRAVVKLNPRPNNFGYFFQTWTGLGAAVSRKKFIPILKRVLTLSSL